MSFASSGGPDVCAQPPHMVDARAGVEPALVDAHAEESLDEELLRELDALLVDPVDLGRRDPSRLSVLPWLETESLDALREAAPRSPAELAALPGWDPERAQRTRPFVRFAVALESPTPVRATLRTTVLRARRDASVDVTRRPWRVVMRAADTQASPSASAVAWETPRLRGVVGDMRWRHAQGLLWWSGEERLRGGGTAVRRANGIAPHVGLDRARSVRGMALEAGRGVRTTVVVGRHAGLAVRAGVVAVPVARFGTWTGGLVRTRASRWWGVAWSKRTARVESAAELVRRDARHAWLVGVAWQGAGWRLRTRLEGAAPAARPPWAAAPASERRSAMRQALVQTRLTWRNARLELGAAESARRDSLGARRSSREVLAQLSGSHAEHTLELRVRQRDVCTRDVGVEDFGPTDVTRTRSLVVRVQRRLAAAAHLGIEYRAVEVFALEEGRRDSGSAWVLRLDQRTGSVALQAIVSSYASSSGRTAPYVPDPYVAGAIASRRVSGEGVRLACGVALERGPLGARVRAASVFAHGARTSLRAEGSLTLRVP